MKWIRYIVILLFLGAGGAERSLVAQEDPLFAQAIQSLEKTLSAMKDLRNRAEKSGKKEMVVYLNAKIGLGETLLEMKKKQMRLVVQLQKCEMALQALEKEASEGDTEAIRKEQALRRQIQQLRQEEMQLQQESVELLKQMAALKPTRGS